MNTTRHFVIFTGFFDYETEGFPGKAAAARYPGFSPWFTRLGFAEADSLLNVHLKNYLYSSFSRVIFPESLNCSEIFKNREAFPDRETLFEAAVPEDMDQETGPVKFTLENFQNYEGLVLKGRSEIPFTISYADLAFYPDGTGLFTMKIRLPAERVTLERLSDFIFQMRDFNNLIVNGEQFRTVRQFINEDIIKCGSLTEPLRDSDFNSKLKTFTFAEIEGSAEAPGFDSDKILYDLGTVSPIGTAGSDSFLAPADSYYDELMENNKISLFKSWSALSLFDSFTVLSTRPSKGYGIHETAETYYFPIYLHNLYLKLKLYSINRAFAGRAMSDHRNTELRDDFISFRNNYDLSHISYNFLPEMINRKIRFSVDTDSEISLMEEKVEKINAFIQEKQDMRTNGILLVLSVISIFSVFLDFSDWFQKLFKLPDTFYPFISGGLMGLVLLSIVGVLAYSRKRSP